MFGNATRGRAAARRTAAGLAVLVALAVGVPAAQALPFRLAFTLQDPFPVAGGAFGVTVAAHGTDILVGSPGGINGPRPGMVYLFDGTSGALVRTFPDPNPAPVLIIPSTRFGIAIAVQGNRLLVGAPLAGRQYVFDIDTGTLLQTLPVPAGLHVDCGRSVAFAGTNPVVGCPATAEALLYDGPTGSFQRLFSGNASTDFGVVVAGLGPNVLVSKSMALLTEFDGCGTTLFDSATGTAIRSFAGTQVAVSGTNLITGCPNSLEAAFLYDATTGTILEAFSDPNAPPQGGRFGAAVAARGADILVGSPTAFDRTSGGAVYLFAADGSLLDTMRNPNNCCADADFGTALAVAGDNVVVGAVGGASSFSPSPPAGLVYVFVPSCGDGHVDPGEQCDDGNNVDGDCCSARCRFEAAGVSCAVDACVPGQCDGAGTCTGATLCTDQPVDAASLVLKRTASHQKITFVSRDPRTLFAAGGGPNDPSLSGLTIDLFSASEGSASFDVPPGLGSPGWTLGSDVYRYSNRSAPGGPSAVKRIVLRAGRSLKLLAAATGLPLAVPQGAIGIRFRTGTLRTCALFDSPTITRDEAGSFRARGARAASLRNCADATLAGP